MVEVHVLPGGKAQIDSTVVPANGMSTISHYIFMWALEDYEQTITGLEKEGMTVIRGGVTAQERIAGDSNARDFGISKPKPEPQWEMVEIECRDVGIAKAANFVNTLFDVMGGYDSPDVHRCQFILRRYGPAGEESVVVGEFLKLGPEPVELLRDRREAQSILDGVNRELLELGCKLLARGPYWYSYRYRKRAG